MDFVNMNHDPSTFTYDELVDVVKKMEAMKEGLQADIAQLKHSRCAHTEQVFKTLFSVNPKQANSEFIDFEDDSKTFVDRINACTGSMLQEVATRESSVMVDSTVDEYQELLLELARKENEFKELADEKLSRLVPIKNRPEYKVAQEALQRSRFSSSSSSFSSEDNKALPTLPKEDNKENKILTWLINRGEALQQSFRDDTNASIRAMRRRTTTHLDTLYEEAKGALHEKQKVDDVGTDKMLTDFHKVYTNRMLEIDRELTNEQAELRTSLSSLIRRDERQRGGGKREGRGGEVAEETGKGRGWKTELQDKSWAILSGFREQLDHSSQNNQEFQNEMDHKLQLAYQAFPTDPPDTNTGSPDPMSRHDKLPSTAHDPPQSVLLQEVGPLDEEYLESLVAELGDFYTQIGVERIRPKRVEEEWKGGAMEEAPITPLISPPTSPSSHSKG